ncbi:hypothetical protein [Streptomyces sp. NPDC005336]|uniref:hypothetical protein n=1 Tax=Streptomyces sp. NPDC005336 TaxID=3157035 RepID=UPI0033BF99F6
MVRAGTPNPVIGVCGINPHAGERWALVTDSGADAEEIRALRAEGVDVVVVYGGRGTERGSPECGSRLA